MELMTLNDDFQPEDVVENYSSLVWSERYDKAGDFQLTTTEVGYMLNLLKLDVEDAHSYVTLRESVVPMVVEVHKIEKKKGAAPVLTVTGRAFETVLERRASVNQLNAGAVRAPWVIQAAKASDAAYEAMRVVLGDDAQFLSGMQVLDALAPAVTPLDAIPEIELTMPADYEVSNWTPTNTFQVGEIVAYGGSLYRAINSASLNKVPGIDTGFWSAYASAGSVPLADSVGYEIAPKDLYNASMELIVSNHRGLKAVRPLPDNNKISIEIYNGADLTNDLVFDIRLDQVEDSTYLLSEQGSANVGYVYGSNGAQSVLKTAAPEPSGLNRRVLVVDASSDGTSNTSDIRRTRGLIELYNSNKTALFDGQVAEQIATGFNSEYFLGDILRLDGDYGLSELVRVVEFIRTSDATGEKAYPTFEVVN
jgi:hypothetical protein